MVRPGAADGQGLARTRPAGSASDAGRLRRHPRGRAARRWTRSPPRDHELVGVVTRPDAPAGRGRQLVASPVAARAEELGVPVLKPDHPRDPDFQDALRGARARLLPGRRLRRAAAAVGARHPARTAGSTCTSRCCPPGAAPRRCSTRIWAGDEVTGATTFRIVKELDAGPTFGVMTERIRPDRHRRRPAGAAGRGRRRAAGRDPGRDRGRLAGGARAAGRGRHASRRRSPSTTPAVDWTEPAVADRPAGPRLHARRRAPGRRYDGERLKLGPVTPSTDAEPLAPGELAVGKSEVLVGTGTHAGPARRGQGVRQEADARRRLGPRRPAGVGCRSGDGERGPDDRTLTAAPPRAEVDPARLAALRGAQGGARRRRLRQPGAARRARASTGSTGGTRRSPPSWPPARSGGRARTTRSWPPASTGRSARSRRRCSTCCGSAPTSCSRCGCPPHAAVSTTVDLVRAEVGRAPAGFVNAVLRKVAAQDLDGWVAGWRPTRGRARPATPRSPTATRAGSSTSCAARWSATPSCSRRCSRPTTSRRRVTLVARPGRVDPRGAAAASRRRTRRTAWCSPAATPARSPRSPRGAPACRTRARSWSRSRSPRRRSTGRTSAWLDLCAGPGRQGRAAGRARRASAAPRWSPPSGSRTGPAWCAAAAAAAPTGSLGVVDRRRHRAAVRGRARFDRVLVDAPCTGLGALRRRPEARWRRTPDDLRRLVPLQRRLLAAALDLTRPGRGRALRDLLAGARRDRAAWSRRARQPATDVAPRGRGGRCCPTCRTAPGRCPAPSSCGRTGTAPTRCSWRCCAVPPPRLTACPRSRRRSRSRSTTGWSGSATPTACTSRRAARPSSTWSSTTSPSAPGIVNALFERPCMLHRFPKGLAGDKVHQKRLPGRRAAVGRDRAAALPALEPDRRRALRHRARVA